MNKVENFLALVEKRGFESLQWRSELAKKKDVLFYKLPNATQDALDLMKNRLAKSSYGSVVVNSESVEGIRDASFFSNAEFFELREKLVDKFYPLQNKKFIAITGTNGKTTTVDLIRQILVKKGVGVITVGTLGVNLNQNKLEDFGLTSPDYIDLRKALHKNRESFEVCALEASSHAIEQKRLGQIHFDSIGWTSFSQDHLDYHKTMEEYFQAKRKLMDLADSPFVISKRSKNLMEQLGQDARYASKQEQPSEEFFKSLFNMVNLDVALGCLAEVGYQVTEDELSGLQPPPGRFNVIRSGSQLFVIDFAHTPDALENICRELKASFPEEKLICVFGCGGDRDRGKRPLMGKAAEQFCDYIILTSDNPRFEDPEQILSDIEKGLVKNRHTRITDREQAIKKAVEEFPKAVILIAGKGHEAYIDVAGVKRPYSDQSALERILRK